MSAKVNKRIHGRFAFTLMAILIAGVLVSFLAGGTVFYRMQERRLRVDEEQKLLAIAQLKVDDIARWRQERLGDATVALSGPYFPTEIERYLRAPDPALAAQITGRLDSYRRGYRYASAFIVDATGRVRLSAGIAEDQIGSETAFYLETTLREQRPLLSELYRCSKHDVAHLDVIAPLIADTVEGKAAVGALILRIDPNELLYPLIQSWPIPSETAETLLVRRDSDEVVFLNELRHRKGTALNLRISSTQTEVPSVMAVFQAKEGIADGLDYRGVPVLSVLKHIPDSSWYLVAKIDTAEAFSAWRFQATAIIIGTLLFLVLTFVGIGLHWYRERGRHYRALYQAEKEGKESEEKFNKYLERTPDGVFMLDRTGRFTMANIAACRITGYSADELEQMSIRDLLAEESMEEGQAHFHRVMELGTATSDLWHKRKDGSMCCLTVDAVRLSETQILGFCKDITDRKRAEQLERQSRKELNNLFEASPEMISFIGFDGRFKRLNPAWERTLGYPMERMLSHPFIEFVHPDDRETTNAEAAKLAAGQRTISFENRYKCADGSYRWLSWSVIPATDEKTLYCVTRDITERKRQEEALRESEREFRLLAEAMPQIVWITRPDGWNIYFNQQWLDYTGQTLEESYGHGWNKPFHPDDRQRAWDAWQNATKNGADYSLECRLRRADGVYKWWLVRGVPILDAQGTVLKWFGTCTDIHEFKQADELLHASELRYRRLFESAKDGILILDAHTGMVVDVNPFLIELMGFSREDFLGKAVWDLGFFRDVVANRDNFFELQQNEYIRYEDMALKSRDGQRHEVEFVSNVYLVNDLKVVQCNIRDISDRKKLELVREDLLASLQDKNEEMESILYAASHDLRSPLVNIQGFSARIQGYLAELDRILGMTSAEQVRETAAPIIRNNIPKALGYVTAGTDKMDALVNGLLKLSRLGRATHTPEPIDMSELMRETLDALKFQTQEAQAVVTLGGLPSCWGDRREIGQAFSNLVDNAIKYRDPLRPLIITISGTAMGDRVTYTVTDTGIGIKKGHQDQIWGLFSRLDPGGHIPGEGLGLALVKRIVQRNRGKVWVESEPGKGTVFYIVLPHDRTGAAKQETAPHT